MEMNIVLEIALEYRLYIHKPETKPEINPLQSLRHLQGKTM